MVSLCKVYFDSVKLILFFLYVCPFQKNSMVVFLLVSIKTEVAMLTLKILIN